ncbi:MAG TPA: MSMEG_1061 family FMN-dependent PPOX-type flavoprotein [Ilumatobacter sp.]|nr:MSMEG_1061 family FMN-dependent PPOX-type flavoprotein [Ilumatobacter sp.]
MPPFAQTITTSEALYELYRRPHPGLQAKKRPEIDPQSAAFIATSPFLLIATTGADGGVDVSPRGGDPGFVQTERIDGADYVLIPDLNGNNLLDSLQAIADSGRAGLLFVIPGKDDTLRVNGEAWVVTDDAVLDRFTEIRRPKATIAVRADEVFVHCAKAFRRGKVWDPQAWEALAAAPGLAEIVCAQGIFGEGVEPAAVAADLERGYAIDLAGDRPG